MRTQDIRNSTIFGLALSLVVPLGCNKSDDGDDEIGDETGETTGDGDTTGDTTGDGDGDGDGDTTTDDTTGDGDGDCAIVEVGEGAVGDPCLSSTDCASALCLLVQDTPPLEGTCEEAPAACGTRFSGRILDFETGAVLPDIDLKVAAALQAALMPGTATALAMGSSDANGLFDFTSDAELSAPLGLVGLASASGYYLTATGMAAPRDMNLYGPGNGIHDIWAAPEALLTSWSALLMPDPEFTNQLPLGDAGGVIGLVRDDVTGTPVAGAVIVSTEPDTTGAVLRYLNETGDGFVDDMTTTTGIFVLVKPGLGEVFGIEVAGVPVVDGDGVAIDGTAGSANGAIFTLIMDIPAP